MSSFSVSEVSASEIAFVLASEGIVSPSLKPDDLASPSLDLLLSIFSNFFACIDPLSDGADDQIGFAALKHLDNPDHHADSIRILNLYRKAKDFLASIRFPELTLRDLLKPDPGALRRSSAPSSIFSITGSMLCPDPIGCCVVSVMLLENVLLREVLVLGST
uniref:Kinetochore protein Nuf2 N-terminal domain-containing protein n=1 Tax=Ananas comosus var. bracteatus TaxID=296719 RepID=A0A6V7Q9W6_ANACO|nr:unnamed protein product [Ananas comosus var. bracteatus]